MPKLGSAAFTLAAVGLLALAIFWPPSVAEVLRSRMALSLIVLWSAGVAFLLHPELAAGFAHGIREFRKASREVEKEIWRDDDDDDPHAT